MGATLSLRQIDRSQFFAQKTLEDKIRFLLRYAILAPSTHNSQPWLFSITPRSCRIFIDPFVMLPEADPVGRDCYISIGACIENLIIAAAHFGVFERVEYCGDADPERPVTEVFFCEPRGAMDAEYTAAPLLEAITTRVNARGLFKKQPVPETLLVELIRIAEKEKDIQAHFVQEKEHINQLARLTASGLRMAYRMPRFRREMARWMRHSLSKNPRGIPGYSLRMPFILSFLLPKLIPFFDFGPILSKLNQKSVSSAPLVCVLSAERDAPETWMRIGRLAERLMLTLWAGGAKTSVFVAAIEMDGLYKDVQRIIGSTAIPQFLFCAGYMDNEQKPNLRVSVEEKLRA